MRIVFDIDFDGGGWPGPLGRCSAVAGERWAGPSGLLSTLEVALGLKGCDDGPSRRMVAMREGVESTPGFWSRSAEVDSMAAARVLLRWYDGLREEGWTGDGLGQPRLEALATLTNHLPPGRADRLFEVVERLANRDCDIDEIVVLTHDDELPALWHMAMARLAARGTRIVRPNLLPAGVRGAATDLGQCLAGPFDPRGDGSLMLYRPHGSLAAADELAAWLAARPSLDDLVVVGADAVLDDALARHGLPTTGARRENGLLHLLSLLIEIGASPVDPATMRELLLLPRTPIDEALCRQLLDALRKVPATVSREWCDALAAGGHADFRLLHPTQTHDEYEIEEVHARVEAVRAWLRERPDLSTEAHLLAEHCARLLEILPPRHEQHPLSHILALVAEAVRGLETAAVSPPQAGLHTVSRPGAVTGPVGTVVWWGFNSDSAPSPSRLPFTGAETEALLSAGVRLRGPGDGGQARAARWRRPLQNARDTLLLVCPAHTVDGEEQFVHPLWDEIVANLTDGKRVGRLECLVPGVPSPAPREAPPARSLPVSWTELQGPVGCLDQRDVGHPSSLGSLVGCPLQYVLHHVARIRPGISEPLSTEGRLIGNLGHELFRHVFSPNAASEGDVEGRARAWLLAEGPAHAAALFQPGNESERDQVTHQLARAAADFATILRQTGAEVTGVEVDLPSPSAASPPRAGGFILKGRADMLVRVGDTLTVVDLKRSGTSTFRGALETGSAYQLAAYAHLAGAGGGAYYVLTSRSLLSSVDAAFQHGAAHGAFDTPAMFRAFDNALLRCRDELRAGRVRATGVAVPGVAKPQKKPSIADGVLVLEPPCKFCNFKRLCGVEVNRG